MTRNRNRKKINMTLWLMILPGVVYFFLFSYLPMSGIVLAFKNYSYSKGIFGSPWVGFDNFKFFFLGGKGIHVLLNTIGYNFAFLVFNTVLQVGMAIFLSVIVSKWFVRVTQTMLFFPFFLSWVIVGAFMLNIFNFEHGVLNTALQALHMDPIDIYSKIHAWKYIIVSIQVWKWLGYGTVIYLAAVMSIEKEMYEASEIDGANKFQEIFYLTIPSLVPYIITLTLVNIGNIFKGDFNMFYQITGNNPILYPSTDVIDTFVVRSLLQLNDFGMTTAAGFMQSVFSLVVLLLANSAAKRLSKDSALF
ncbi:sugar ABC transporter permease [Cohnella endophytica]|uniref:Sugar ABC transporter permease n=2 Tax=Cohnella endophytica TaxID=2419778 RepID=A0A494XVC6_9BACL|nr:sugar ABC transporter permease [Cohnella endophytica]